MMETFSYKGKKYQVDSGGFLINGEQWDENFAEGMAKNLKMSEGLNEKHWNVVRYIRKSFQQNGKCPLVYETCRENNLSLESLKRLFPTGYLRGACKLSGLTYKESYVQYSWVENEDQKRKSPSMDKIYRVNILGFLIDSEEWDEDYAANKAREMKMDNLTQEHWKIIRYLRDRFKKDGSVPTLYMTCEDNQINLDELEKLFPDGYHRGAVKIAGLRAR